MNMFRCACHQSGLHGRQVRKLHNRRSNNRPLRPGSSQAVQASGTAAEGPCTSSTSTTSSSAALSSTSNHAGLCGTRLDSYQQSKPLFESSAVQAFDVCRGPTSQETCSKLTQHPTLIRNSSHQEVTTHEMHSPLQSLMLASWKARRRTHIMHHHQVIHPHLPARSFLDAVHGSSFFWPVVRLSATGLCSTCTAALYASRLPTSGIPSWSLCTSARPTCNPCTLTAFCRTAFLRARQRSLPSTTWICATTWLRAAGLQRARTAEDAN